MSNEYRDLYPNKGFLGLGLVWWGVILGIVVVGIVSNFALGWIATPFRVAGVQNVEKQWEDTYTWYNKLKASAGNVCQAETVLKTAPEADKSQRQSQVMAYQQNYRQIQSDYDASVQNAFKAKLVKPADLPATAPTLDV